MISDEYLIKRCAHLISFFVASTIKAVGKSNLSDLNDQQRASVLETIDLIETELTKTDLNNTLIRALIANLRPYAELNHYRRRLAETLDVELI